LHANYEAILILLEGRAPCSKAKFAHKGRTKIVTLPCEEGEATLSGEAIQASPIIERRAFKAKPKASQPKGANF